MIGSSFLSPPDFRVAAMIAMIAIAPSPMIAPIASFFDPPAVGWIGAGVDAYPAGASCCEGAGPTGGAPAMLAAVCTFATLAIVDPALLAAVGDTAKLDAAAATGAGPRAPGNASPPSACASSAAAPN